MRNSVLADMIDAPRHSCEPWATSVGYAFAAFDILNSLSDFGEIDQHDIPFQSVAREHGFRRPAGGHVARELSDYAADSDSEIERPEIAQEMLDGRIDAADLFYLFRVTARYCDFLESQGEGPAD